MFLVNPFLSEIQICHCHTTFRPILPPFFSDRPTVPCSFYPNSLAIMLLRVSLLSPLRFFLFYLNFYCPLVSGGFQRLFLPFSLLHHFSIYQLVHCFETLLFISPDFIEKWKIIKIDCIPVNGCDLKIKSIPSEGFRKTSNKCTYTKKWYEWFESLDSNVKSWVFVNVTRGFLLLLLKFFNVLTGVEDHWKYTGNVLQSVSNHTVIIRRIDWDSVEDMTMLRYSFAGEEGVATGTTVDCCFASLGTHRVKIVRHTQNMSTVFENVFSWPVPSVSARTTIFS